MAKLLFLTAATIAAINVVLNVTGHGSAYESRVAANSVLCLIALGLLVRSWSSD